MGEGLYDCIAMLNDISGGVIKLGWVCSINRIKI